MLSSVIGVQLLCLTASESQTQATNLIMHDPGWTNGLRSCLSDYISRTNSFPMLFRISRYCCWLLLDHRKRLRTQREAYQFIDGHPEVQPLAVRVKGGTTEPQVLVRLIFIVADQTLSFFRSVDQVLPTAKCRMVSATEASQMSHIGL